MQNIYAKVRYPKMVPMAVPSDFYGISQIWRVGDLVVKTSFLRKIDTPSVAYVPVWV